MKRTALLFLCAGLLAGAANAATLTEVATSKQRWTGVATNAAGQIFVNYPRWSDDVPISVAELKSGTPVPVLDRSWHDWKPGAEPANKWVCVQSVVVDRADRLWVLDPGNPKFGGVVPGAPKLVHVDLKTNAPAQVIRFPASVASGASYLNDVRIDTKRQRAFITDSGRPGIVVVDLATGTSWRTLDGHASTSAEDVVLNIGGKVFDRKVHADGIALSQNGDTLYFQALTGRTVYRIDTRHLANRALSDEKRGTYLRKVGTPGGADGLLFDPAGAIWLTSLEKDAIRRLRFNGEVSVVVKDPRLAWPDSLAIETGGSILVTVARIHEGDAPKAPFALYRITP